MKDAAAQKKTCSIDGCEREIYFGRECILHASKSYNDYWKSSNEIKDFSKQLFKYIKECFLNLFPNAEAEYQRKHPHYTEPLYLSHIQNTLKENKKFILIDGFEFPESFCDYSPFDLDNFYNILHEVKYVTFDNCKFFSSHIHDGGGSFVFKECVFKNIHYIRENKNSDYSFHDDSSIYQRCTFEKEVYLEGEVHHVSNEGLNLFHNCKFNCSVEMSSLNSNFIFILSGIPTLKVCNSFLLNDIWILEKIGILVLDDSIFKSEVFVNANVCEETRVSNCTFEQTVQFKECHFGAFRASENNFLSSASFYGSVFDRSASFFFDKFYGSIDLRKTFFSDGLDIETITFQHSPNFLGAEIRPQNTSRETYRIIKHSFDSVGNHLEGNKFFAEEMKAYRKEIKEKDLSSRFAFWINDITSNFGQRYTHPIIFLLFTMIIHYWLYKSYNDNLFIFKPEQMWYSLNDFFYSILKILPFFKLNEEDKGFATIAFVLFIVYTILIYQLVVALKRLTRR